MSWVTLQIAAIVVGLVLVVRGSRLGSRSARAILPFLIAIVIGAFGAALLGTGPSVLLWWMRGSHGRAPELELAGFGALAGIVLGFVVVAPRFDVRRDALAPAIGAMIALSRVGCFVAGCDFGAPTNVPWGMRWPVDSHAWRAQVDAGLLAAGATSSLPVHPVQLYEATLGAAILAVTLLTKRARLRFAVVAYAVGRIVLDFFRGDLAHDRLGLTPSQWLALATIVFVFTFSARRAARSSFA